MALRALALLVISEAQIATPPYSSSDESVYVGTYVCDAWQYAQIYYPKAKPDGASPGKVPLLSFAHGLGEGGTAVPLNYGGMLSDLASWGYVVIAGGSAVLTPCLNEYLDQLSSLEWVKKSAYSSKVDWSLQTGVLGHSMGGIATITSASSVSAIANHNIGAAVALHPCVSSGSVRVPTLFATGSADAVCAPAFAKAAYNRAASGVSKAYADIFGATHFECQTFYPQRMTIYAVAMFDCHIKGIQSSCVGIYDDTGPCSLCNCPLYVPMTACLHANAPVLNSSAFEEAIVSI